MRLTILLAVLALPSYAQVSGPQSHHRGADGAQGSLAVTAVVTASVALSESPDGTMQLIVANAPDPKESFSDLSALEPRKTPFKSGGQTNNTRPRACSHSSEVIRK